MIVPTHSGRTARSLSLFRMPVWIAAVSSSEQTCRDLLFSTGYIRCSSRSIRKIGIPLCGAGLRAIR
jgi:pyruvate kinase